MKNSPELRVLLITPTVGEKSGWGRHSGAMIDGLLAQGVPLAVAAEKFVANDSLYAHQQLLAPRSLFPLVSFIHNLLAARRAARGVSIVHALDGWPYGVYAYAAVLGTQKKLFTTGIGTYSVAPLYSVFKGWLLRLAYARAEKIFCISEYTKSELIRAGIPKEKLPVVLLGPSDLPAVSTEARAQLTKRYRRVVESSPVILTVGAVKGRKGQLETLKAIEILKEKHPHILYAVVGRIDEHDAYVTALKSYVHAHGLENNFMLIADADDEALSFLYEQCSLVALNSFNNERRHSFEGFGIAIIDAYWFAKPAVGSRDTGIESSIIDGETGLLARQQDPTDIARAIDAVLANYDSYSRNATMARERFSWAKATDAYLAGYRASL